LELAETDEVADRSAAGHWTVVATDGPTDDWFDTYWAMESSRGRTAGDARVYREVLLAPKLPARFVTLSEAEEVHSVGQIVVQQEFAGVQCRATRPDRRRVGGASCALHHLALEASALGAKHMYLAVMADNAGARQMYERAGFVVDHEYCYLSPRV
jgi:GNAT superfamily N-acetyltransferase